jgi:uncharacterized protein YgiM (DUF1202 family)
MSSKGFPLLLSCFLLGVPLHLCAQEEVSVESSVGKESALPFRSFEPFSGVISGTKVRMRAQPNLDAYVIRETAYGEMFAVQGEVGGYYAVTPPKGTKGYVFRTYILENIVEGERVNVRLHPDIDAPVIGQLNKGDRIASTVSERVYREWWASDSYHDDGEEAG